MIQTGLLFFFFLPLTTSRFLPTKDLELAKELVPPSVAHVVDELNAHNANPSARCVSRRWSKNKHEKHFKLPSLCGVYLVLAVIMPILEESKQENGLLMSSNELVAAKRVA
jgi:hypothetical protein